MFRTLMVVGGLVLAATAVSPPGLQCPDAANAFTATGWQEYRAGRLEKAQLAFATARARCPDHIESQVGLGYVALRGMALDSARTLFARVVRADPKHVDGLTGLGLAAWRLQQYDEARALFTRVLALDPERADVREHLGSLPEALGPPPVRPPLVLPDSLVYHARVAGERFEVRAGGGWAPFYINGVNLGAALPGKYPSQFPDAATYRGWLADIGAMGANTVRVYTLHPPAFYQALADYNAAHPARPLWLLHGVWAELPPDDDYDGAAWKGEFFGEMERVIDVLHGRADVAARPGHAAGYYTADVSRWTLGLILGREWEPYSVAGFNERHPEDRRWDGRYFRVEDAPAMDVWLAEAMEHAVAYETARYRTQRPVAYTNWPTLDPMRHPTELDVGLELTIRGLGYDRSRRAHNEDEVSVGAVPMRTTSAFPAGYFAAFHVYPYYPDLLLHDPGYNAARSPWGPSSYYGYLADLKRQLPGVPIVLAEYGVPVSWGIAHFNPQGWHHGGHTEAEAAAINARLTREVAAAGYAGGILFAWIDEWFKHNWLVESQEEPRERNRLWWNRLNPEQHYGVIAMEPERRLGETLLERSRAWSRVTPLYATPDGTRIRAHADEGFLWLHVSGPAARASQLLVGLDVLDANAGAGRLPGAGAPASPVGLEYALVVDSAGARIVVTRGANPFTVQTLPRGAAKRDRLSAIANRPSGFFSGTYTQVLANAAEARGAQAATFEPQLVVINRARVGADSTNYLGLGYDRGVLRQGPLPDGAWERGPLPDELEFRIPWNLVGVTDPSSRHVGRGAGGGSVAVEDIRIVAAARGPGPGWQTWPQSSRRADVARFTWAAWEEPRFTSRRRPVFDALRQVYRELDHTSRTANQ